MKESPLFMNDTDFQGRQEKSRETWGEKTKLNPTLFMIFSQGGWLSPSSSRILFYTLCWILFLDATWLFPLRTCFRSWHQPLPYHTRSLDHQQIHQVHLYNNPYLLLNHYLTMNPFWSFLPPVARPSSVWLPSFVAYNNQLLCDFRSWHPWNILGGSIWNIWSLDEKCSTSTIYPGQTWSDSLR